MTDFLFVKMLIFYIDATIHTHQEIQYFLYVVFLDSISSVSLWGRNGSSGSSILKSEKGTIQLDYNKKFISIKNTTAFKHKLYI